MVLNGNIKMKELLINFKGIYNLVTNKAKTYKGWKVKKLKGGKN